MNIIIETTAVLSAAYFALLFIAKAETWLRNGRTFHKAADVEPTPEPAQPLTKAERRDILSNTPLTALRKAAIAYNASLPASCPNRIKGAARLSKAEAISRLLPHWEVLEVG